MKRFMARYHITRPSDSAAADVAVCHRYPFWASDETVGAVRTVAHYGPGRVYSTTAYRRVKAGWRVVRAGRLGGLRWQQGRKR